MRLALVLAAILAINVFFGYWRANTRRLSPQWLMAIHIPVPIAIGLRLEFLGWSFALLPAFVAVFFVGQFIGDKIRRYWAKRQDLQLGSFLLKDLVMVVSSNRSRRLEL